MVQHLPSVEGIWTIWSLSLYWEKMAKILKNMLAVEVKSVALRHKLRTDHLCFYCWFIQFLRDDSTFFSVFGTFSTMVKLVYTVWVINFFLKWCDFNVFSAMRSRIVSTSDIDSFTGIYCRSVRASPAGRPIWPTQTVRFGLDGAPDRICVAVRPLSFFSSSCQRAKLSSHFLESLMTIQRWLNVKALLS
jgi:hypothetical protein